MNRSVSPQPRIARLGRLCHRRRWLVLLGWVAATAAGILAAGPVFAGMSGDVLPGRFEAFDAYRVLERESTVGGGLAAVVDRVDPDAAGTREAVTRLAADLAGLPGVAQVHHPYSGRPDAGGYVAADRHAVLVEVLLANLDEERKSEIVAAATGRLRGLSAAVPGAAVRVGGDAVLEDRIFEVVFEDLGRAEAISLPISLVLLVFVFGGVIAAGLPLAAAVATGAASFVVLLGFGQFVPLDFNVPTIVSLLGLGLSVDYGLLLVARYRDELAAGSSPDEAVARTWATAGRTITFSALTVAAALAGLLVFPTVPPLQTVGAAGIAAALVALLAALTLTAALLGFGRRRIRPSRRARTGRSAEAGLFARTAQIVQRRPLLTALGVTALLLAAAAPLLHAKLAFGLLDTMPKQIEPVGVAFELEERFGRDPQPSVVVVARTPAGQLQEWADRHRGDPGVTGVGEARQVADGLAVVDISAAGKAYDRGARDLVDRLRADRPAGQSWISGPTAEVGDTVDAIRDGLPWALTVIVVAMLLLLFAMTGSVVLPVKAVAMNAVSLGAAFGVLVLVFQDGWLAGALDIVPGGALSPITLVVIFALAFGLSMDYEVFLLGHVTELASTGLPTDVAVRQGLQRSGGIITSAAAVMVIVFGSFATARIGEIEQLGIGLAVAVLVDATIVRCLLVPATMTVLGRWNWWAPAPLKRLHARFGLREEPTPAVVVAPPEPSRV